ncbi:hypothetical protein, partial [Legionella pneumophila]
NFGTFSYCGSDFLFRTISLTVFCRLLEISAFEVFYQIFRIDFSFKKKSSLQILIDLLQYSNKFNQLLKAD